jgi:hypothetical protein
MALSPIEDRYLSALTALEFPDMPVEPEQPLAPTAGMDGMQLAAGPSQTMSDAGGGRGSYAGYDARADAASKGTQDSMKAYDPTVRERMSDFLQAGFERFGMDRYKARQNAQTLMGGQSSNLPLSLGLADIVPFLGTGLQTEEAVRMGGDAVSSAQQGNYGTAALQAGGAALGLVPGVGGTVKAAKPVANMVGEGLNRAILEGTGPLAKIVPQSARPLFAVEPGKFNPKVELPKAVDIVAADPSMNVYLPQAQRAPSVALRLAKPEIQGTGDKGTLTVGDIGTVLEKSQLAMNKGKPLDPTKPKDLVKMVDSATAEAEYQMSQPISGATWYEDDVAQAFALGSKIVPELATDEPLRVVTTAFAASTSYNKRAGENWSVAMRIAEDLMKTGKVASRNPDNGKLWGGTTGPIMEQQLKLHQYMIDTMGMDKYAEWLLTPHTVKEISDMKAASGLYKTPGIPGKATDMKMGSFILGEKGGAFFLNLNGIKETTADKWFTRTYNRHTGTLTSGPVSEQGLVDAPRNETERSVMKVWNRSVAENMGLDEQANQAVLWYYEQSLYYNLGIKSARSESFSDGAKNLLNARGIPFTDADLAGARGRSNAGQTAAEPRGAATGGNPVGVGEVAPNAAPATVTGGRSAPKKGAK